MVAASRLVPQRDERPISRNTTWSTGHRSVSSRVGSQGAVGLVVAGILLGASLVSVSAGAAVPVGASSASTGSHPIGQLDDPIGDTSGGGTAPRDAVGGDTSDPSALDGTGAIQYGAPVAGIIPSSSLQPIDLTADANAAVETEAIDVEGPFLADGTLLKPVAVDTTVDDGRDLVRAYTVKSGDTLKAIAKKFHVSIMTVYWANNLKSTDLKVGQNLRIPPVSGLIVTVAATDTLGSIAAKYKVGADEILTTNDLTDPNLVVGQILVLPGAAGKPIPKAPPRVTSHATTSGGGSSRPPSTYTGGHFLWPLVGGGNYISQYFHYGHGAIDIAANYGTVVRAAGGGTVIFAGWKNNGGGYQVWIAHGSNLYTTYNHMSAITVGNGQSVGRGQQVGRVGMTGDATGPHLHFEVWVGPVWNGGQRVNPLKYL